MTDTAESPRFFPGQFVNGMEPSDGMGLRIVMQVETVDGETSLVLGHPTSEMERAPASGFKILLPGAAACKEIGEVYGSSRAEGKYRYQVTNVDKTSGMMRVVELRDGAVQYVHPYWIPWVGSAFSGGWTHLSLIAVLEEETRGNAAISKAAREARAAVEEEATWKYGLGMVMKPNPEETREHWPYRVVTGRRREASVEEYQLVTESNSTVWLPEQYVLCAFPNVNAYLSQRVWQEREQLNDFKHEVGAAARKAKAEHGWCSEVDTLLRELDVPVMTEMITAVVTVTVEVDLMPDGSDALKYMGDLDWFTRSVKVNDSSGEIEITADSDFDEEPEIRYISHTVTAVTDQSYPEH